MKGFVVFLALLGLVSASAISREHSSIPVCPEPETDGEQITFPNEDDCNSYYVCNGPTPYLYYCTYGFWYNPNLQKCDYPENVEGVKCIPPTTTEAYTIPTGETEEYTYSTTYPETVTNTNKRRN